MTWVPLLTARMCAVGQGRCIDSSFLSWLYGYSFLNKHIKPTFLSLPTTGTPRTSPIRMDKNSLGVCRNSSARHNPSSTWAAVLLYRVKLRSDHRSNQGPIPPFELEPQTLARLAKAKLSQAQTQQPADLICMEHIHGFHTFSLHSRGFVAGVISQ